ncbi:hypothetical protein Gobs_3782 [Geodermatophilus obscurus DSM 43160]|jgi:hypothetical protein|uniref:Uncharacterized protein n=1 Tax=Geodermatophilus obscurus (strain ATCC 25078 / DSM 43160 / JCM 3152 / CCUG 61914 / KCC A-0152 / KCTC 9177 / NBRC 13315 / NRRL B-3577 / G-20) TaxID=526225 RepID=D2SD10_GEOOG|nr:hypothetical protein [Geodermatophilus obscurus]ADB76359.1 hypothetical protein Gobs_3782 [Geodermatophilus obscurus DSM 43160]
MPPATAVLTKKEPSALPVPAPSISPAASTYSGPRRNGPAASDGGAEDPADPIRRAPGTDSTTSSARTAPRPNAVRQPSGMATSGMATPASSVDSGIAACLRP